MDNYHQVCLVLNVLDCDWIVKYVLWVKNNVKCFHISKYPFWCQIGMGSDRELFNCILVFKSAFNLFFRINPFLCSSERNYVFAWRLYWGQCRCNIKIWIHSKASVVSIIKYIYVSIVLIHLKQFSRVLPGKSMNFLVAIKLMSCCELLQRGKPNDKEQTMTVVYMCIFYSMQCKIALPGWQHTFAKQRYSGCVQ